MGAAAHLWAGAAAIAILLLRALWWGVLGTRAVAGWALRRVLLRALRLVER